MIPRAIWKYYWTNISFLLKYCSSVQRNGNYKTFQMRFWILQIYWRRQFEYKPLYKSPWWLNQYLLFFVKRFISNLRMGNLYLQLLVTPSKALLQVVYRGLIEDNVFSHKWYCHSNGIFYCYGILIVIIVPGKRSLTIFLRHILTLLLRAQRFENVRNVWKHLWNSPQARTT